MSKREATAAIIAAMLYGKTYSPPGIFDDTAAVEEGELKRMRFAVDRAWQIVTLTWACRPKLKKEK